MTCREFTEFLAAYLAAELAPAEMETFERHLAVCEACTNYLASYRTTIDLSRAAFKKPESPVPEAVPEDLIRAILAARKR